MSPILLCFDGSEGSRTALEAAVQAFRRTLIVACYWAPDRDRPQAALAERIAGAGAALAQEAGGHARPVAVRAVAAIDRAILEHADEIDAFVIALGSRGAGGRRSLLLGSTAGNVVERATRPVLVVPSSPLAQARRADRTMRTAGDSDLRLTCDTS